jgi:hypothetical protein
MKIWRVEHGNGGWEIWEVQKTGSMRVAVTGHAGFDKENAQLMADAPRLRELLGETWERLRRMDLSLADGKGISLADLSDEVRELTGR